MTENEITVEQETTIIGGGAIYEAGENIYFTESKETGNTVINADDMSYDDTEIKQDISDLETNKADKNEIPDVSNFITKDVNNLTNYTKSSDLSSVATSGNYNDLSNKPTIPDVSNFITKDVNNLTYYTLAVDTGHTIDLSINSSTYVMTLDLKNSAGTTISTDSVDLPLESMVVSGAYDDQTKKIILTLQSGSTIEFSVADLVSGLQTEITSNNKLSADLVDDTNTTNKFVTSNDITNWNNKSDFSGNYNDLSNKPTIPSALSDLSEDTTHRVVTDTEKTTWNAKQNQRTIITSSTATYTISSLVGNTTYKLGNLEGLTINQVTTFDDETNMYFASGSTATTISIPDTLVNIGDVPTLTASGGVNTGTCEANKNYIISICNNIAIWKNY